MSTRVAILGAGGQIGRTLLTRLRADSKLRPYGVCRNALTAAPLRAAGLDVRCGDVTKDVKQLLGDADVIVNCASASCLWGQARKEDRAAIDAILSIGARVIHFSSVAVYGSCIDSTRNTYDDPRPDIPYGRDKLNLERYTMRHAKKLGRRVVILRMGHVYGAEQWVSRFVFNQIGTSFRLPFDGDRPSNAVHVANVASAVRTLVHDTGAEGAYNLFDPGNSSWREVFDWNTNAIGADRIPGMDVRNSERVRRAFAGKAGAPVPLAIAREVAAWTKSLPLSLVSASPSLRDLALSTMSTLQAPAIEQKVLAVYGEMSVRRMAEPLPVKETWLVSDGAPGRAVDYPPERGTAEQEAVAEWHEAYASPDALFPADDAIEHGAVLAQA